MAAAKGSQESADNAVEVPEDATPVQARLAELYQASIDAAAGNKK